MKGIEQVHLGQIMKCPLSCEEQLAFASKGTAIKVSPVGERRDEMVLWKHHYGCSERTHWSRTGCWDTCREATAAVRLEGMEAGAD